jgi:RNA polymerase sigma-70 factor (ECF subfamily)
MAMRDVQAATAIGEMSLTRNNAEVSEQAIENLYDSYARSLFRYAYAITRSAEDAEDALQEVFSRIARDRKRPINSESIKSYLFTAVRNASYSILRSRHRRDDLAHAWADDAHTVCPDAADCVIRSEVVRTAFAAIPAEQREVLVLKIYEELSFKEIAAAVGVSINTVASRYRYAIEKLREALEADDNER